MDKYEQKYKEIVEWARKYKARLNGVPIEEVLPELRESEDERIRKEMIDFIQWAEDRGMTRHDYHQAKRPAVWIAWLEKQKEHHLELKAGKWYICHRAFCARADHLTVKEGERFQCEKDGIVKGFVIKEPEKYFKECSAPEPMEKEQKPAESISQLTVQGKGVYKICPRCKERMVRDDSMVYTSMPPQYIYECPKCGDRECDTVMYDNPEMEEQKPAAWSEEDEDTINLMIAILRENHPNGQFKTNPVNTTCMSVISTDMLIKRIESLKPQSHWKPSEEQLKHLLILADYFESEGAVSNAKTLRELYEDLKKL